jgi:hypothetical protein
VLCANAHVHHFFISFFPRLNSDLPALADEDWRRSTWFPQGTAAKGNCASTTTRTRTRRRRRRRKGGEGGRRSRRGGYGVTSTICSVKKKE